VLFYEKGVARPDLVLKDLIKIGQPQLLKDHKLQFFTKLDK
jgi:iron complex transport system substrate-binding protein